MRYAIDKAVEPTKKFSEKAMLRIYHENAKNQAIVNGLRKILGKTREL